MTPGLPPERSASTKAIFSRPPHAFYDPATNSVHVGRWRDPIADRVVPGDLPLKRLQGITVYVANAATARAFVDGQEVASFSRNPADETGRASITFVDNSTPTAIFDEVDLQQRPGRVLQTAARVFPVAAGALSGNRAMEVVTQGQNGSIEWRPDSLSCARTDALQFAVKRKEANTKIGIELKDDAGQTWQFLEEGLAAAGEKAILARFTPRITGGWEMNTFRFDTLDFSSAGKPAAPWGKIASVKFLVSGDKGASAQFNQVACLRQNPLDDLDQGFRISGRITFGDVEQKPTDVVMEFGGQKFTTTSSKSGVYQFDQRVPRGSVVMVYAVGGPLNDRYDPTAGRLIEVRRNMADIDVTMAKDPRAADLNGSVPAGTKAQGKFVIGVGPHYLPGSRFSSTGLSKPTEYLSELQLNNLGYIDREQRVERIADDELRVMVLGVCNMWGHTEPVYYNVATVMEALLSQRLQKPVEVMNMSTASQHAGLSWFFYDKLGRSYKPDVVFYGPLDVGLTDPTFAQIYNMTEPDHLPAATFLRGPSGGMVTQPADANYANFPIKDQEIIERRNKELTERGAYIIDGVNMMYLFHRDPGVAFSSKEQGIYDFYKDLIGEVKRRFEADGVRVIFVVTDHFGQAWVPPNIDGVAYKREFFDQRMDALCKANGAECMHFVPWMERHFKETTLRTWRRDSHYSRIGYRWFAEAMTDYLVDNPARSDPKLPLANN